MYRVKEAIIGYAIGDALGVYQKGMDRDYLLDNPVLKMTPSVKKGIPAGAFGDATSLMLATMNSITKKGIDYNYITENCIKWFSKNKYGSVGESFGIGKTTLKAFLNYSRSNIDSFECGIDGYENNGNSSLKMMLPLAFYFNASKDSKKIYEVVKKVCSITHKHEISICSCYIYVHYVLFILAGNNKFAAFKKLRMVDYSMFKEETIEYFSRILVGNIYELDIDEISSSSFVVDTLESVLWCFIKSDNLKDCMLAAANIGLDTETIGALSGALAGIYYGTSKLPKDWIENLKRKEYLTELSEDFERYLRLLSYN